MKVLQAITSLGVGGAERVVLTLASECAKENIRTSVVCFSPDVDALKVYGSQEEVRIFPMNRGAKLAMTSLFSYTRFLKTYRPDVVHAHLFHAFLITLLAQLMSLRFCPIVFTLHNSWCAPLRSTILKLTRQWRRADVVFSETERDRPWLSHMVVIPNGVEVAPQPVQRQWDPARETVFIYVGRLVHQKNPAQIVRELRDADVPGWRLLVVGSGPELENVVSVIDELGLSDRVSLFGRRSDVRQLLQSADVFLCLSDFEGLPMAILEAGAENLVVVSTPVGSIPALIGSDAGYLTTKEDFSETLRRLVATPAEALARAAQLRVRVTQQYSTKVMVRAHVALYLQVSAQRGAA